MTESPEDVVRYLAAARAGSQEALGQMLEAYRSYLMLVARGWLAPDLQAKGGASDLVQETFIEAFRAFPRFDGNTEAEVGAWLCRLVLNNAADFTRRYRGTDKRDVGIEVPLPGDGSSGKGAGGVPADGSSPSAQAIKHEETQALHRALVRLPADQREVIRLHHEQDLSFEEGGRLMGRSPNAPQKLWARGLAR